MIWNFDIGLPSLTDTFGHTKTFDYPVMDHWGKVKLLWHEADSNCRSTVEHAKHQTTMTAPSQRINIPRFLNGGMFFLMGGSSAITTQPRVGHPGGGGLKHYKKIKCLERVNLIFFPNVGTPHLHPWTTKFALDTVGPMRTLRACRAYGFDNLHVGACHQQRINLLEEVDLLFRPTIGLPLQTTLTARSKYWAYVMS